MRYFNTQSGWQHRRMWSEVTTLVRFEERNHRTQHLIAGSTLTSALCWDIRKAFWSYDLHRMFPHKRGHQSL